jgi:hypothetical protein
MWLLSGVNDLWTICCKPKKKLFYSQHNVSDMVYGLGVCALGLTEDVALGVCALGLTKDIALGVCALRLPENVALGVYALGLTKDIALGVYELGLPEDVARLCTLVVLRLLYCRMERPVVT